MRFHTIDDVLLNPADTVFRAAAWPRALSVICGAGLAGVMIAVGAAERSWVPLALAGLILLFTLVFLRLWIKAMKRTNWVLIMRPGGLVVRLRSYLNSHFPREDIVAVELDRSEIAGFGAHRLRLWTPAGKTGDNDQHTSNCFLHIYLKLGNETQMRRLGELIAAERKREAPRRGPLNSKTKYLDYPASLVEQDGTAVLRIEWKSKSTLITPGLGHALKMLGRLAPVFAAGTETIDLRFLEKGDADGETQLLALVEAGEVFTAIKLARQVYGFSLTEAKAFVEGLANPSSKVAAPK